MTGRAGGAGAQDAARAGPRCAARRGLCGRVGYGTGGNGTKDRPAVTEDGVKQAAPANDAV